MGVGEGVTPSGKGLGVGEGDIVGVGLGVGANVGVGLGVGANVGVGVGIIDSSIFARTVAVSAILRWLRSSAYPAVPEEVTLSIDCTPPKV
ncbi:hypothetical protein SDC9_183250 [bioreactor metagenome]|uniref:Uncharacterized protein n=1 Tax=bioreactor metagenome TaxID=1076179 RepID=A0A645H9R0_9ZZZZ